MISVIVPVYNVEKYLNKCIESILCQTYSDLEIILVDDGSTDCSGRICDKCAQKDSRVRVIHKENGGLVSARQAGLTLASGEYIGFADSDDWMEQDLYQTLYNAAMRENADVVAEGKQEDYAGECFTVLNQLPAGCYRTADERRDLCGKMISCRDFFSLGIQPYLWNKLFRRELLMKHLYIVPKPIRVGEDAAVSYPVLLMAECVVVLDTAQYHYCHHQDSMMLGYRKEEQEYDNAVFLHRFLKTSFMELGVYHSMKKQMFRYSVNNLLARSYGRFADADTGSILFPFPDIKKNDSLVIYGAGALGTAVYQYAVSCAGLEVKAIVDQRASYYRKIGFDIDVLEDVDIESKDKLLITVFDETAYYAIREDLRSKGIKSEQILWIDQKKLEEYFKESDVGQNAESI